MFSLKFHWTFILQFAFSSIEWTSLYLLIQILKCYPKFIFFDSKLLFNGWSAKFFKCSIQAEKNRERENLYLCLVDFLTILAPTFLSSQLMNRRKVWLFPITGKTLSDSNRKNRFNSETLHPKYNWSWEGNSL
jgi:hypothetical protein